MPLSSSPFIHSFFSSLDRGGRHHHDLDETIRSAGPRTTNTLGYEEEAAARERDRRDLEALVDELRALGGVGVGKGGVVFSLVRNPAQPSSTSLSIGTSTILLSDLL